MKLILALLFSSSSAIELSRFTEDSANVMSGSDLMSSTELNQMLNQKVALQLKSYSRTLEDVND